jgi:hypothetical protein
MKTWISNWNTSTRLDTPAGLSRQPNGTAVQEIHQRLSHARPELGTPEDLHFSIMQRLRREKSHVDHSVQDGRRIATIRWAGAATAALCLGAMWLSSFESRKQPASPDLAAIDWSEKATKSLQVVGALDQELEHLDRDLRAAAEHLIASVP